MKTNLIFLIVIAFSSSMLAQNNYQYILYKDYPYYVSVNPDGYITEFIRTAPEVMKGQQWDKNTPPPMDLGVYSKPVYLAQEYNSPLNTTKVGENVIVSNTDINTNTNEAPGIAVNVAKGEPSKVEIKPTNAKPMKTTVINLEPEPVKESKVIIRKAEDVVKNEYSYDMEFQGFTARLTPELVIQLEDISKVYENNPDKSLEISSFVTAGDETNKKLAMNRMDACRSLLIKYGVPEDKITTGIRPYRSTRSGQVNIAFID